MPDRGYEDRPPRQPREALDLRHVLVFETECVKLEGWAGFPIMRLDHRFATAGITADRAYRDRVVGRDDPRLDERAQQTDGAGRVTTGIGDFARQRIRPGRSGHFGKAVGPLGIHPVRGAGVEQFRRVGAQPPSQRGCLSRGIVRQAQDDEVDAAIMSCRAAGSLRRAAGRLRHPISGTFSSRCRMPRPVVPASPSMKTLG